MDAVSDTVLTWWSNGLMSEPHTTPYTPQELKDAPLTCAVVVMLNNEKPIAAARLTPARTRSQEPLMHAGKEVLELGSNYVDPNFRNQTIGRRLIEERLRYVHDHPGYLVVVTTSNPIIEQILLELGAKKADSVYADIKQALCLCPEGSHYSYCSFSETGNLWVFETASSNKG